MLTNREELDRLFHDKLSDFTPNPPPYLWDNIELRLNSKKRSSYPLKMFGVAAAVLILIFTGWWIHPFTSHNAYLITQNSSRMENNAHPLQETPEKKEIPEQNNSDREQITVSVKQSESKSNLLNSQTEPAIRMVKGDHSFNSKQVQLDSSTSLVSSTSRLHEGTPARHSFTQPFSRAVMPSGSKGTILSSAIPNKVSPWSIEIKASPFFTSSLKNLPDQQSSDEQTFSGGILVGYNLSKRVRINSGLLINGINRKTEVNSPALLITANLAESPAQIQEKYRYCEIPVTLNYKVIDRKLKVGLSGGLSANILASEKANINTSGEIKAASLGNLPNVTYAGMIGLEIGYQVSKKITVTLEPLIKHYLNSSSEKSDLNLQSLQAGLYTGVRYSFN